MTPHYKRPVDPNKLLPEKKGKKKTTPEETAAVIASLEKDLLGVS